MTARDSRGRFSSGGGGSKTRGKVTVRTGRGGGSKASKVLARSRAVHSIRGTGSKTRQLTTLAKMRNPRTGVQAKRFTARSYHPGGGSLKTRRKANSKYAYQTKPAPAHKAGSFRRGRKR